MRILFCNITYLKYYDGREAGEYKPKTGGRWVRENEDAHEKWNFLNMDGYCYGYVQGNSEQMHIEKLDRVYRQQDQAEDITVVWCAIHPARGTVIVGWYEHATVYRYVHEMFRTPVTGIDERWYWFKTKAEDAYLLPESERPFTKIGRAGITGAGTGFGQQNYWFAESKYAREIIIPEVLKFIENNREKRINTLTAEFMQPKDLRPLSKEEERRYQELGDDENMEYLSYSYRKFANEQTADNAYAIADSLSRLYQYKMSIPWDEKTIELDPGDYETMGALVYVYQQCREFKKSTALALKLLSNSPEEDQDYRDEVYCVFADNCYFDGDIDEAISWLDRVLRESKNKELIEYTKETKRVWLKQSGHK